MKSTLPRKAFFVSISSDIASYIALKLLRSGTKVNGTFRSATERTEELQAEGAVLYQLNCNSKESINDLFADKTIGQDWDLLMISPATMNPINQFQLCDWDEWEASYSLNSLRQFQILHAMMPRRNRQIYPLVFMWSGPGTNDAPVNYTAEITAKIAQIKMCELLDKECEDIRFIIVGPGWVNTKAHKETLAAKSFAGTNYERTLVKINSGETTGFSTIYEFFTWAWLREKSIISGRNFSIRGDIWGTKELNDYLKGSENSFKLRRFDNDWRPDKNFTSFSPK